MIRKFVGTLVILTFAVFAATLLAAEYKGKVKSADPDKNEITITIEDKDKTFKVAPDVKVTAKQKDEIKEIKQGLKFKQFSGDKKPNVTLVTEGEGDKEIVKEIKVGGGKK